MRQAAIGHDGPVSDDIGDRPEPKVNPDPETAPGGADATPTISDPGAAGSSKPVTPDQPLSAQTENDDIPDEIQEAEGPDESISDESAKPEVHPTD